MKFKFIIVALVFFSLKMAAFEIEKDSSSVSKKFPSLIAELNLYSGKINDVAVSYRANSNHFESYFTLAKKNYTKKDFKIAIEEFETRVKDNPLDIENYVLRGLSKDLLKTFDEIEKYFEEYSLV